LLFPTAESTKEFPVAREKRAALIVDLSGGFFLDSSPPPGTAFQICPSKGGLSGGFFLDMSPPGTAFLISPSGEGLSGLILPTRNHPMDKFLQRLDLRLA
jgi:hypothetical protein